MYPVTYRNIKMFNFACVFVGACDNAWSQFLTDLDKIWNGAQSDHGAGQGMVGVKDFVT